VFELFVDKGGKGPAIVFLSAKPRMDYIAVNVPVEKA
jgi:hypothetical protein